ncbi:MAG: hypothetical protein IPI24_12565 [Ignavibacteria bacterium]|nr:hypothetical protein [Ignavibacteria bacterium]
MLHTLLLSCSLAFTAPAANDSVRADTTVLPAVNVVAERWLTDETGAGMPITRLDNTLLARLAPQSLVSVLPLIPGVFVRDYGGLGGLKTFSIRGAPRLKHWL